jgi:hypothetical protein
MGVLLFYQLGRASCHFLSSGHHLILARSELLSLAALALQAGMPHVATWFSPGPPVETPHLIK